ncbi:hypothetical protein ACFW04_013598 [Cataglyphis niger]
MYGTIRINNHKVKHAFYVVRDDISIKYEGILGIDFLRQHLVTCDYKYNRLKIGNAMLNLHPFNKIILKPRSETIIKASTDQNRIRIVRVEEKAPRVYIGNCIVNAADYMCFRLRENNLKLQPDKCEFLRKEVIYLGHIISENGISPDPSKLMAIKEFPTPKKGKDIQSFIGLAGYYRKFIEEFSKIAKPLTKLMKPKKLNGQRSNKTLFKY